METGNFLLNRTEGYDPQAQRSVRPHGAVSEGKRLSEAENLLKPEPGSANSLRSDSAAPGPNANFRPLTSLPLLQMHRGGGRSAAPGDPSTFWRTEVIYSMDGFTYSLEIYCFF